MTRPGLLILLVSLAGIAGPVAGQASQFGVRGLGLPGHASSARVLGSGGALGLFDGESSQNPASLATLSATTAVFTMTAASRKSTNPAGDATGRDTRFPQMLIGGPIPRSRFVLGVSYSLFTDRDFQLVSTGSESPRGVPVAVTDTLTSRGGISDIRLATGWAITPALVVGGGIHFLTGSNRMAARRVWADDNYAAIEERAELSYHTIGFSAGVLFRPLPRLEVAALFRRDGELRIERDSTPSARIAMPVTLSAAARFRLTNSLDFAGQATLRDWSRADAGLRGTGAVGARDTREFSGGVEFFTNRRKPTQRPIRIGIRYAELPFLLDTTGQPSELALSAGTGLRFARDLGGIDIAVERTRRSQGGSYTETAWQFTVGISVRPGS